MVSQEAAPPAAGSPLIRWRCPDCGQTAVAQEVAWIDHLRASHHCPTPREWARALRGEYDG